MGRSLALVQLALLLLMEKFVDHVGHFFVRFLESDSAFLEHVDLAEVGRPL